MEQTLQEFNGKDLNLPALPGSYIKVEFVDQIDEDFDYNHLQAGTLLPFSASKVFTTSIVDARKLAEGEDIKTVYEIFLDNSKIQHEFNSGDTIAILTKNFEDEVNFVVDRLGISHDSDKTISIKLDETTSKKNVRLPVFMPKYGTFRRLLTEVLDLRNIPKKLFLRSLVECTADPNEKRFLEILCSKEGTMPYRNLILDKEVTFLGLLRMLGSCKPPIHLLLENLPRLMPRPYSIANNWMVDHKKMRIVFSIYSEKDLKGLTSTFLENAISSGHELISFYFRNQTGFSFDESDIFQYNQILIGVGTAISPYLGFLEHKSLLESSNKGKTWLFVGCRYKERNHIYENQLKQYLNEGTLTRMFEAFSRDSPGKHVQDLILENKEEFFKFLQDEKTKLYVCGSPKMVEDIQQIIEQNLLAEEQSSTVDEIKKKISEWKKSKKYVEDVWH